jgi:ribonuclease I
MALPISQELYQQLVSASVKSGFEKEAWEIGTAAIREWMIRNNPERAASNVRLSVEAPLFTERHAAADHLHRQEFSLPRRG